MNKRYEYLETLDCFEELREKVPCMLDDLEKEMKWYEEVATDEEIGECGENLSSFLVAVYGGNDMNEWIETICEC